MVIQNQANMHLIEKIKHLNIRTSPKRKRDFIRINYKSRNGIEGIGVWVFKDAKNIS